MVRSVLAVLAGYLVFALSAVVLFPLAGQNPDLFPQTAFLVFSIVYGFVFALLGGYIAAGIAGRKEILHAACVTGIIAIPALVSMIFKQSVLSNCA